jgi:serine/threonine-protein kinase
MGVVYLAEQTEPLRRQVALKVIKPGMDTRDVITRFEAERQALAVMDHPNIATVFDGGASEAGRPYFVMEYVDGIPITEYCDQHSLSIRERLELFIPVCHAVQHAHQKGLVHRDLKPSNVLVTVQDGEAIPKVIDFGIAKAIDQRLTEVTLQTQTGYLLGTPAYMSPEQAEMSGLDIDTRADIYSLGVILYELLVGALPFQEEELTGIAAIYTVLEREPPTLSSRFSGLGERRAGIAARRRVDVAGLGRQLKGDLDWIALKAMEKDRARRYDTANALAIDLRRYLADEPVLARAPSAAYRTRKFVARHMAAVVIAAAALLGLIVSSIAIAYMAIEADRARRIAEGRRVQAEDLISFMVGDLREKLEPVGRLELLDDVGDKALEYFAALPDEALSDDELYRRSQALYQIGEVRLDQGNLAEASLAFDQSLALARDLAARDRGNLEWQYGLGQAYFWGGYLHYLQDDLDAALPPLERYREIAEQLAAADPANLTWQLESAYASSNIGTIQEERGELQAALTSFQATLAVKQALTERAPENLDWRLDLASEYNKVGRALQKLGDLQGAERHYRADLEIGTALVAGDSSNTLFLERVTTAHYFLGQLLEATGDLEAAIEQMNADLAIAAGLLARDSSNAEWARGLATSQTALGEALIAKGELERAAYLIGESHQRLQTLVEIDSTRIEWQRDLARTRRASGRVLLALDQAPAARSEVERAVAMHRALVELEPESERGRADLAESYSVLGETESQLGNLERSRELWSAALAAIDPLAETTDNLGLRATLLLQLDRLEQAEQTLAILRQRGYRHPRLVALSREKGMAL